MPTATVSVSSVSVDTSEFDRMMGRLSTDQVPYAISLAINNLAFDTVRVENLEILSVFDKPTPFIQRGLRVGKKATKQDPTSFVWFKDVFGRFGDAVESTIRVHIEGGTRREKSTEERLKRMGVMKPDEWLVSSDGAKTDRYGNIPASKYTQVLSYFRAFKAGERRHNRRVDSAFTGRGTRYVILPAPPGRVILEVKGKRGTPKPLFYLASRTPNYKKTFDFYGEAHRHARKYAGHFGQQALEKTLASQR